MDIGRDPDTLVFSLGTSFISFDVTVALELTLGTSCISFDVSVVFSFNIASHSEPSRFSFKNSTRSCFRFNCDRIPLRFSVDSFSNWRSSFTVMDSNRC
jgi:hypothetical protein